MRKLEFFFDYGSPWSYIANSQLPGLGERTGCEIVYRPMLLGGVFKTTGNASPAASPVAAKLRYGGLDLRRWAEHYGIAFEPNPHFPINTLLLMRIAHAAQAGGVFERVHACVYPAFWAEAKNLGDSEVLRDVLRGVALDADALLRAATHDAIKKSLREVTEEAVARGAFGAPTFFVGDEMFFGNDRLLFVERALRS